MSQKPKREKKELEIPKNFGFTGRERRAGEKADFLFFPWGKERALKRGSLLRYSKKGFPPKKPSTVLWGICHLGELPDYACTPDGYYPQTPFIISPFFPPEWF
ncbi:hypothetical protein IMY97_00020 [Pectobacterium versatile]|uniref:hypothetical protein n=1 Tax=Pectobacterium versatile TaxID=2488639 RepID=UPI001FA70E16|nr:hypothetical protein [Pectobacterium versatile]QUI36866.2 hypothetical protein IMY97_00020 [Pectobacterium versatile]